MANSCESRHPSAGRTLDRLNCSPTMLFTTRSASSARRDLAVEPRFHHCRRPARATMAGRPPRMQMREFDLVIIGAGVAGLTAAMFAGRYGLKPAVVERIGPGGQIINAERIENFPGFPQGLGGHELGPLLHEQAEAAGAEFVLDTVEGIEAGGEHRI